MLPTSANCLGIVHDESSTSANCLGIVHYESSTSVFPVELCTMSFLLFVVDPHSPREAAGRYVAPHAVLRKPSAVADFYRSAVAICCSATRASESAPSRPMTEATLRRSRRALPLEARSVW